MATPTAKTPAQVEKEKLQAEWCAVVKESLDLVISEIPKIEPGDVDTRAALYRNLLGLKEDVAQCDPPIRKLYNKAVDMLFEDMDAIPGALYLGDKDPKP